MEKFGDIKTGLRSAILFLVRKNACKSTYFISLGSARRVEDELREKTPWGRQAQEDLDFFGIPFQVLKDTKPTGIAIRATLEKSKTVQPVRKKRGAPAGRPKTAKRTAMEEERRQRLDKQREENAEREKTILVQINGKAWHRRPRSTYNYSVETDGGEAITFRISNFYFCENSGMEEATVYGRVFRQDQQDKTWTAVDPIA
ncbi:unnamed protein product [Amoebophrya sp. A120]|nr:unnamed protein product [Amoebophrya sp. A120]|eukprot:GSA120T00002705001.1